MKLLRRSSSAAILLYHRAADPELDPQLLSVSPARFTEHLDVLETHAAVVSLARVAEERRGLAITFDDGYADNFDVAAPLLATRGIAATVFVTTGYLGRRPWWDELESLLLRGGALPESLELEVDGVRRSWPIANGTSVQRDWSVLSPHDPSDRHGA
jgi:peptidoglycan/xylan/chitin deacetylase (PgdA/CDA1 family)